MPLCSKSKSSQDLKKFSFSNFLILLLIHLIHFLAQVLGSHVHITLLTLSSITICWHIPISSGHIESEAIRKIKYFILFLLISSLSKAFLLILFTFEENLQISASTDHILISTGLTALIIILFTRIKGLLSANQENMNQKLKSLIQEKDEALRSAEEIEFLVMMLTHDSRNVLNCLLNTLKFLEDDLDPSHQNMKKAQEDLQSAKYCSDTLLNFFNNYLESRMALSTPLKETKVRLPDIIQKIQQIIKGAVQFKKLQANLTIDQNTPTNIILNESSLIQIMLNLIYNAIKFTDRGGVDIRLSWKNLGPKTTKINRIPHSSIGESWPFLHEATSFHESPFVSNATTTQEEENGIVKGRLYIEVSDTGCGLLSDALQKLFNPFTQINSDPSKKKQGFGLGLWLTKRLIEKLGGQIKVKSQFGRGSTFIAFISCQADTCEKIETKKEWTIEATNKISNIQNVKRSGVFIGRSSIENLTIKTYMKSLGLNVIETVKTIKDLWSHLTIHQEQDLVIVVDEHHIQGLNELYRWNKSLLDDNKLIITVDDVKSESKTYCQVKGVQSIERPVRLKDFLRVLTTGKATQNKVDIY